MKITVKDAKTCEKILTIELGPEEVRKEFDEFYQSVAPHAKVPGFRPGKAPRAVLAMHYREEAREKVLKRLMTDSYHQALREKTLEPLGMPEIHEVDFTDNKLSYQAHIEIRPKIKLNRTTGLAAKRETATVPAQAVETALQRVRESLVQYKAVEDRAIQMGDFVIADYVCYVGGREAEKRTDEWFEIREDEFLKGFSPQLVGAKLSDEREVQITLPGTFGRKEWAGKSALFKVKVKEIKTKILPELNDELAQAAGEFKTLAELRQQLEKDLLAEKDRAKEAEFEKALLDELLKHNKLDLPEKLVQRRLEHLMQEARESFRRRGASAEDFDKAEGELREKLAAEARRQVHLAFLLDEIATREGVSVSEEDVKQRVHRVAESYRINFEAAQKYYAQHEDAREALRDQIRNEKAIEFIKKNAKQ